MINALNMSRLLIHQFSLRLQTILHLMAPDIRTICKTKPKTAFDELYQLDSGAIFRYFYDNLLAFYLRTFVLN